MLRPDTRLRCESRLVEEDSSVPKSSFNESEDNGCGVEGELISFDPKLVGGRSGASVGGFVIGLVVADGGGGGNEKADFCGSETVAVVEAEDWKSSKSPKSSSSPPPNKFTAVAET